MALCSLLLVVGLCAGEVDDLRTAGAEGDIARTAAHSEAAQAAEFVQPHAYLVPARYRGAIAALQRQGVALEELREDCTLDIEVYRVTSVTRKEAPGRKRGTVRLAADVQTIARMVPAGTLVVPTAQPLASLIVQLLEPEAEDGRAARNFFSRGLAAGREYPVVRLPREVPLLTCKAAPLPGDRTPPKRLTYNDLYESKQPPSFSGSPLHVSRWFDDGEHYEISRAGKRWKVEAATGRMTLLEQPSQDALVQALAALASIDEKQAASLAARARGRGDASGEAGLFEHDNDLYWCRFDGTQVRRLTSTPVREELYEFSPDGQWVSFVADNDLWVVDVATATPRQLTTGGGELTRNGKLDWVYFEELFGRRWKAYWWAPDSARIAFLHVDSTGVDAFVITDNGAWEQRVERAPFPKPGTPNPRVRLGIVTAAGGGVAWADFGGYLADDFLVSGVTWWPDSSRVVCWVQNRIQSWIDLLTVPAGGGAPARLFRDATPAWIKAPAFTRFLADGSFLVTSERSGWQHLYHYGADGALKRAVTGGEWEMRRVAGIDEQGGWVYFMGTRDSPIAEHFYRVKLDGGEPARLTAEPGHHAVSLSPTYSYFVDRWSSHASPERVHLAAADGRHVRVLDTNPVRALDAYRLGRVSLMQIAARDGFPLEALQVLPLRFSPARKHPVWLMTYAGPQAPSVRDAWAGGRAWDHLLAASGIIVVHVDPRSASGKGAVSAWSAYRRLGAAELEDIEDAVKHLAAQPYVDAARIGLSGYSYGGYMTAYALTHSTLFAAGIAGAPVTDWRDYDSIYTERYMSTPQDNPEGYARGSVTEAAARLHGRLLLVHGDLDDNVHLQHTTRLARALQDAGKRFELMIYPGARHGVGGKHWRRTQYDFILRTVGGARDAGASWIMELPQ